MNENLNELCCDRLIEMRKRMGFSQSKAARRMHLSAAGYGNYENGLRNPSWPVLFVMSLVLETSVDYLTGKTENPAPDYILTDMSQEKDVAEIIAGIRNLTPSAREAILTIIRELNEEEQQSKK